MTVIVSIDSSIYQYNGSFFVVNSDLADLPMRYLRVFERVRLVGRVVPINYLPVKYVQISHPRLEIWAVPYFRGIKQLLFNYISIQKALCNVSQGCDAAVLRIPSNLGILVWKKVYSAALPYAVEVVYDACDGYKSCHGFQRLIWYGIHRKMQQICFLADGVSCVTQHSLQQQYYTKKKDGFESYYSSIMLPHNFYGAPRRLMAKNEYIVAHASNPIIYKGRKGHIEVIKAISIANKNGYNVRVKFAGGGDNASLESLCALAKTLGIEDKVEFVGFLSKEELRQMLLEADLFVMPTRAEGLPRVIIEAMAVGLPCISTNVSGNSELLQPEFLLDNYSDIQLLSQKIIALLTDADLYAETSKHNFTISQQYEQLILQKRRDLFYSKLKEISQA